MGIGVVCGSSDRIICLKRGSVGGGVFSYRQWWWLFDPHPSPPAYYPLIRDLLITHFGGLPYQGNQCLYDSNFNYLKKIEYHITQFLFNQYEPLHLYVPSFIIVSKMVYLSVMILFSNAGKMSPFFFNKKYNIFIVFKYISISISSLLPFHYFSCFPPCLEMESVLQWIPKYHWQQ